VPNPVRAAQLAPAFRAICAESSRRVAACRAYTPPIASRFKLRTCGDLLAACLDRATAALHEEHPDMGATVAIDGNDLPTYADGQRFVSKGGRERERLCDPRYASRRAGFTAPRQDLSDLSPRRRDGRAVPWSVPL
jgi:hypothetical protein